ncbi:hypothetical protein Dimus_034622 [Dionaea muscipula]
MVSGSGEFGAYKALKWQALHGSLARRLVIRAFLFAVVISILPLMQLLYDDASPSLLLAVNSDVCATDLGFMDPNSILGRVLKPFTPIAFPHVRYYAQCRENGNLTMAVVRELMGMHLLDHDARALCVGLGSPSAMAALRESGFTDVRGLGFANAYANGFYRRSIFRLKQKQVAYELDYEDNSFNFVLTKDLDKVSVPALLVEEVERVLKPGGLGAVLVGEESAGHGRLIRSATPVSSFLKSSTVIHVTSLMGFTLVAFKKKIGGIDSFEQYHLPTNCPSIERNKPFIGQMEPLVEEEHDKKKQIVFLPNLINMTSDRRLVYVDMGAREALNFSSNNWFLPSYPIDSRSFDVNIVDHNALVLSSHVNKPGVTFIYHPGLSGDDDDSKPNPSAIQDLEIPIDDEDFDFLVWFKDVVEYADFVVVKMNVGKAELKFLFELFESGAICSMDELFLQCSDADLKNAGVYLYPNKSCMDLFKALRSRGVFIHQWWGN